ncbi:MAG: PIG-L deacetylase family protein [Bacteroidia bacterium]|jgi:LmbE family N-acetylglucosaminyl deacetylase|nr:PIG-L deacetylase family protein [Bacteroidia bacterium]
MKVTLLLAHADDESLGVGGTVPYLIARGAEVQLVVVSDGVVGLRDGQPDNRPALEAACAVLGIRTYTCLGIPDQRFETVPVGEIARAAGKVLGAPDLIISHAHTDLNRDHRITLEVARILARPRGQQVGLLGCEIPCVSAWNQQPFQPQLYIDIEPWLETKLRAFGCYVHEGRTFPDPYSPEGLRILAQHRGMESGLAAAEGFVVYRWYGGMLS